MGAGYGIFWKPSRKGGKDDWTSLSSLFQNSQGEAMNEHAGAGSSDLTERPHKATGLQLCEPFQDFLRPKATPLSRFPSREVTLRRV